MVYLAYLVTFAASINVVVGMVLHFKKSLSLELRKGCYVSVLVQLPIVCVVLIFGAQVPSLLKLVMLALFFIGYYLSAKPSFVKLTKLK